MVHEYTECGLSFLGDRLVNSKTTRFNAMQHGVLSRYTVLPWEDRTECEALLASLVAGHAPQGPTEEHLIEELAGIIWRKRRLRIAEAAIYREELRSDATGYSRQVNRLISSGFLTNLRPASLRGGSARGRPSLTSEGFSFPTSSECQTSTPYRLLIIPAARANASSSVGQLTEPAKRLSPLQKMKR